MSTSATVRRAIKASSSELLTSSGWKNATNDFQVVHGTALTDQEHGAIWDIFEGNMRNMYTNSSFGWDPKSKREELFSPLSRFVLVRSQSNLVAFMMFRFEYEYRQNILYCYDLQVLEGFKRCGLGQVLMNGLETLGMSWGISKIVLTVFLANTRAAQFYRKLGFRVDETSPDLTGGDDEMDYEILSKHIH